MTTLVSAIDLVVNHWLANWAGTATTSLDGERFKPVVARSHAVVEVVEIDSEQETQAPAGARRFRRTCWLRVDIYTPTGLGKKLGAEDAEVARGAYESSRAISGIYFHGGARAMYVGVSGDHHHHRVICPFDYIQIK